LNADAAAAFHRLVIESTEKNAAILRAQSDRHRQEQKDLEERYRQEQKDREETYRREQKERDETYRKEQREMLYQANSALLSANAHIYKEAAKASEHDRDEEKKKSNLELVKVVTGPGVSIEALKIFQESISKGFSELNQPEPRK